MKFVRLAVFFLIVPFLLGITKSAQAACSNPTGTAGDILFNSSMGNLMQSCDGTNWKGWPRAIGSGASGTWRDLSLGQNHVCGLKTDNTAYCWGYNPGGQVGNGASGSNVLYPAALSGGGSWGNIAAGSGGGTQGISCALNMSGALYCWGSGNQGERGHSSNTNASIPTLVSFAGTWKQVAVNYAGGCAIKSDDTAWCWGSNSAGQWGNGTTGSWYYDAVPVSGGSTWKQISSGTNSGEAYVCGIKSDDTVWCWGDNSAAQLGNNNMPTDSNVPVQVFNGGAWKQIASGSDHTCGIKTDGTAWCWGANGYGQGGAGWTGGYLNVPTNVSVSGVTTWKDIQTGDSISCGIKTDGTGWCWGYGQEGNIGDGALIDYNTPHEVMPGAKWKTIHPNWATCGIMENGSLWCWGENQLGMQGIGHTNQTNIPNYVAGSSGTGCASPTGATGDLLFNSAYRVLEWCDGKQWNPAGPISPGGANAGCSSPTGVQGDLLFNSVSLKHQYCDGGAWRGITW